MMPKIEFGAFAKKCSTQVGWSYQNAKAGDIKGGLARPTTKGSAQNKNGTKEGKPTTIASARMRSGRSLVCVNNLFSSHTLHMITYCEQSV